MSTPLPKEEMSDLILGRLVVTHYPEVVDAINKKYPHEQIRWALSDFTMYSHIASFCKNLPLIPHERLWDEVNPHNHAKGRADVGGHRVERRYIKNLWLWLKDNPDIVKLSII